MIRHYDGTPDCAAKITAQSKRGVIWAVEWTWRKHRICSTEAEAQSVRKVWKRWYERRGWTVSGHRAYNPENRFEHGVSPAVCNVVKYDAITREVLDVR